MLFVLWDGRSRDGRDILEILEPYTDRRHTGRLQTGRLEIIALHGKSKNGIAVFTGNTEAFKGYRLPHCTHGICEESDISALKILKVRKIPLITCGMNAKSTVTASSITPTRALVTLQRSLTLTEYGAVTPAELSIELSEARTPFAITAAAAVLLLNGITPKLF